MEIISISKASANVEGTIALTGSKSISNRALLIRALSGHDFEIRRLAAAKDTQTLEQLLRLLQSETNTLDAGPAGTTYRFLTAFLALQSGEQILTGSERMKQRPIGVLVDALRQLGANIQYIENEGFPPLKIGAPSVELGRHYQISIPASVSSQYISALLMIAPTLPNGIELSLRGNIVSRPYIQMTLNLMAYFGIQYQWEGHLIKVQPQDYQPREFTVEADWSAASYYYAMAAFADHCDLQLDGLLAESVQGDAVLADMMTHFGIVTTFNRTGARLTKQPNWAVAQAPPFVYDFLECPDLAQSLAVICGGLGIEGYFSGLQTLKIKETDRVAALTQELNKVNVAFAELADRSCAVNGKVDSAILPQFATYEDHRMAMAFAPLAILLKTIRIEHPRVVGKSYPDFWSDLERVGFQIREE